MSNLHCGFVAIIGRPSSGKSTFINHACGGKVSIVSKVPQTTLNSIRGILTTQKGQIIFIDTPGYNTSQNIFNKNLQESMLQAVQDSDAILYIIDSTRTFGDEEEAIINILQNINKPIFIALNKIDCKKNYSALSIVSLQKVLPISLIEDVLSNKDDAVPDSAKMVENTNLQEKQLKGENTQYKVFKISAKTHEGIENLLDKITESLPFGPLLYPSEFYTDQDVLFRISEVIREQVILNTRDEIPHAVYVKIEDAKMKPNGKRLEVRGFLCVEKESQKGILIGKDATVIKKIRCNAEKELIKIFPYYVALQLNVKVDKNWKSKKATKE